MLDTVNSAEIDGHTFERLKLESAGDHWLVQFAIDGRKYSPFYEPKVNTYGMKDQEFLRHLMAQSLTMIGYQEVA